MCGSEVMCSKKLYTPWSIYRKFTVEEPQGYESKPGKKQKTF